MSRLALAIVLLFVSFAVQATEAGWALLRNGGQVVLLNHADAPGTGDPANFELGNCATQRNLSDRGRQQARRMGALFFARAAPIEKVLTSRYCRARDTADLAFGGEAVEVFEALDYFAPGSPAEETQTETLKELVEGYTGAGNLVLVTHPPNIEALVGARSRDGEAVIVSRTADGLEVAARIRFN